MAWDNRWWRQRGFPELRQILYWTWDPIGVNSAFPRTESEYDDCALQVAGLLARGADLGAVARYLFDAGRSFLGIDDAESATIGLDDADYAAATSVTHRLVEWYPESLGYWQDFGSRPSAP